MRLFVECRSCSARIYLNVVANSRRELSQQLGSEFFTLDCPSCRHRESYHVNDVRAEEVQSGVPAGAIVGAIVGGVVLGPIGLILGGALGVLGGSATDSTERTRVERFNQERI